MGRLITEQSVADVQSACRRSSAFSNRFPIDVRPMRHLRLPQSWPMVPQSAHVRAARQGPSYVVDTACSSALVALDNGAANIRRGRCSAAVTAAANVMCSPGTFVSFSKPRTAVLRRLSRLLLRLQLSSALPPSHRQHARGFVIGSVSSSSSPAFRRRRSRRSLRGRVVSCDLPSTPEA